MQTKTLWWALATAALMGAGCGADTATTEGAPELGTELLAEDMLATGDDALSTQAPTFVSIRRDFRKCMHPFCGGFWVRDVNSNKGEQYVYALNFQPSGLDSATVDRIHEGLDAVLLKGKLSRKTGQGVRRFIVHQAYRGMPGSKPMADATYYAVSERLIQCVQGQGPCDRYTATAVNSKKEPPKDFAEVDVYPALQPFVDAEWLASRVVTGRAIVAGMFLEKAFDFVDGPGWPIHTLDASQVYVRLPDEAGPCPLYKMAPCPAGSEMAFARNSDRCVVPTGCTQPQACLKMLPVCNEGYVLASWPGQGHCPAYACDPTFVGRQYGGYVDGDGDGDGSETTN